MQIREHYYVWPQTPKPKQTKQQQQKLLSWPGSITTSYGLLTF